MSKQEKILTAIRHAGKAYQVLEKKTASAKSMVVDMLFQNKVPVGFNKQIEGTKMYCPEAESLRNGIAEGMGKMAYYLFTVDPKELTKDQMTARRGVIANVGSVMSKFNNALAERYNPDAKKKGADNKTDDQTFCQERVIAMIKRLEKSDNASFDVIEALAQLVKLQKILTAKF